MAATQSRPLVLQTKVNGLFSRGHVIPRDTLTAVDIKGCVYPKLAHKAVSCGGLWCLTLSTHIHARGGVNAISTRVNSLSIRENRQTYVDIKHFKQQRVQKKHQQRKAGELVSVDSVMGLFSEARHGQPSTPQVSHAFLRCDWLQHKRVASEIDRVTWHKSDAFPHFNSFQGWLCDDDDDDDNCAVCALLTTR